VKGHLFEGKFKCQALLEDESIFTCMSYVDLNPIRAKIAEMPEDSAFTSMQERILEKQGKPISYNIEEDESDPLKDIKPAKLLPFAGAPHIDNHPKHIQAELVSYISLVEWAGR
jgi:putative transposase